MKKEQVNVLLRVKPHHLDVAHSESVDDNVGLNISPTSISIDRDRKGRSEFSFTRVLNEQSTQDEVFQCISPSVQVCPRHAMKLLIFHPLTPLKPIFIAGYSHGYLYVRDGIRSNGERQDIQHARERMGRRGFKFECQ